MLPGSLLGKERKGSKCTEEQILFALKQVAAGQPVTDVCRQMGISEALVQPDPQPPFAVTLEVMALAFFVGLPAHFFLGYRFPWILPGLVGLLGLGTVKTGVMTGFDSRLILPGTAFLIVGLS